MKDFPAEYSVEERRWLLGLAQQSIRAAVSGRPLPKSRGHPASAGAAGCVHYAARKRSSRGCIGMVIAVKPLDETVCEMARAAALEDSRFSPVTEAELASVRVEISVLSPMFEIAPEDVIVGRHGLMVSYDKHRGLLLPQVAIEWGWDREMLLIQTCRKAGLAADSWKRGAKIEAFTAEVFGETEPGESLRE